MTSLQIDGGVTMNARTRRSAFTLIELLVVIGIIAILMAILLAALSRAREAATRTSCLSNLHQIAVYLQQYQNQYRGQIPVYITARYADKTIYHGTVNDYTGLGLLVPANIAPPSGSEQGRVFYCPGTITVGTSRRFNYIDPSNVSASNPWVGWKNYTTRITYSLRQEYWSWDGTTTWWNIQYPNARYDMENTSAAGDAFITPLSNTHPIFPSASAFTHKSASAIIMDHTDTELNRRLIHRGGMNVLYANWSAKTIPQPTIDKYLDKIWALSNANPNGGPVVRAAWFEMWTALDQF
jgi:prepilin-type N-terminal cleavage/methylation domain-containing protein